MAQCTLWFDCLYPMPRFNLHTATMTSQQTLIPYVEVSLAANQNGNMIIICFWGEVELFQLPCHLLSCFHERNDFYFSVLSLCTFYQKNVRSNLIKKFIFFQENTVYLYTFSNLPNLPLNMLKN